MLHASISNECWHATSTFGTTHHPFTHASIHPLTHRTIHSPPIRLSAHPPRVHRLEAGGPHTIEWPWCLFFVRHSWSHLELNLSWFQKDKPCCVSGKQPTTRHQDGEKLVRPAGSRILSYRSGGCDSQLRPTCRQIATITAPSVEHGPRRTGHCLRTRKDGL